MLWFVPATVSYFLSAVASIIDKTILNKRIPNPLAYAFYSGILGVFVLFLIPFGFYTLPLNVLFVAFISGASFILFLLTFFKSVLKYDVSKTTSIIGAFTPIIVLILSAVFLKQFLFKPELIAFILFIIGGAVLSFESTNKVFRFQKTLLKNSLVAAFFLAISLVAAKFVFNNAEFLNGFIWMRIGGFISALLFLVHPGLRKNIFKTLKQTKPAHGILVIINKIIGATGFILLNFAISIGPVSLINALKGIEYFFVFIMASIISVFSPGLFKEKVDAHNLTTKIIGIVIIGSGFYILA